MFKIWQKMSFSRIIKSVYKSFYYLKRSITMFNECFFFHWINFKSIHMLPWYIYIYIYIYYNFNIKLNYNFKTWKNQENITLVMVCVIVTTHTYLSVDGLLLNGYKHLWNLLAFSFFLHIKLHNVNEWTL